MKRKRAYGQRKLKTQLPKNTVQIDSALMAENDELEAPQTSMNFQPVGKSLSDDKTEKNFTSVQMETEIPKTSTTMNNKQADLEIEKAVYGKLQNHPNALRKMIASIIKDMTKEAGGLANLSRILAKNDNSISNEQMEELMDEDPIQPNTDMDLEENNSNLNQNAEHKQEVLETALTVIKKTMKLDASDPFNRPVDPIALEIPDYFDVIDTPMDFGTICNNLENGLKYMNSSDVFKDVEYIWYNCVKYNKKGDNILELMKRVKTFFTKYWLAAGLNSEPSPDFVESGEKNNEGHSVTPISGKIRASQSTDYSILRQNKQQKDNQTVPLSKNLSHQNTSGSNNLPRSSQEQEEPNIDSRSIQKKKRGRGRNLNLYAEFGKNSSRLKIRYRKTANTFKFTGPNSRKFISLISNEVGLHVPLHYPSWRRVPDNDKNKIYPKLEKYFDLDEHRSTGDWEDVRRGIKSEAERAYKARKNEKKRHFDKVGGYADVEKAKRNPPEEMKEKKWHDLIDLLFLTEAYRNRSDQNKDNRKNLPYTSYQGSQSFAQRRDIEEQAGQKPQHIEGWRQMHYKNGKWNSKEAECDWAKIQKMKAIMEEELGDDEDEIDEVECLARALGERRGYVRGVGKRISNESLISNTSLNTPSNTQGQCFTNDQLVNILQGVNQYMQQMHQNFVNLSAHIPNFQIPQPPPIIPIPNTQANEESDDEEY